MKVPYVPKLNSDVETAWKTRRRKEGVFWATNKAVSVKGQDASRGCALSRNCRFQDTVQTVGKTHKLQGTTGGKVKARKEDLTRAGLARSA